MSTIKNINTTVTWLVRHYIFGSNNGSLSQPRRSDIITLNFLASYIQVFDLRMGLKCLSICHSVVTKNAAYFSGFPIFCRIVVTDLRQIHGSNAISSFHHVMAQLFLPVKCLSISNAQTISSPRTAVGLRRH